MLGDSITYRVDWNELLSRTDIANRGIDGDITEGFINRLSDIYEIHPAKCFIMGGINDILKDIPVSEMFANITEIAEELQRNDITPIIQSTLFVSTKQRDWKQMNEKVNELNKLLEDYAQERKVDFVDLNSELSKDGALNQVYTYDGVHLLGNGYEKWRDLILPKIQ
jgi:lysophospholipase L1-like esterase